MLYLKSVLINCEIKQERRKICLEKQDQIVRLELLRKRLDYPKELFEIIREETPEATRE